MSIGVTCRQRCFLAALRPDDPEARALGGWAGWMMAPRFKGKPNFDFSLRCPFCGYKIQPNDLMRLASHIIL
jgi:hypothetical protein